MTKNEQKLNSLFTRLVPLAGKADSLAGELVRAVSRIDYRFYNDGDQIGIGYGKQTCNPAARFLSKNADETIAGVTQALWTIHDPEAYATILDVLIGLVVAYIGNHPELLTQPTEDMFEYRNDREDQAYYDEEEDE